VATPRQARSRGSLQRTVAAFEALLAERPVEQIAVADIVRRAKTSVGAFYHRFGSKDALFPYVIERHLREQRQNAEAGLSARDWSEVPLRERVELFVTGAVLGLRARRGLYRALFVRGVSRPHELSVEERATSDETVAALEGWLLERRSEIGHPDPETAVRVAVRSAYALLNVQVLFDDVPTRTALHLPDEKLAAEVVRQVVGYLELHAPDERRAPGPSPKETPP
jgi:AcrR family transcriptional regulator